MVSDASKKKAAAKKAAAAAKRGGKSSSASSSSSKAAAAAAEAQNGVDRAAEVLGAPRISERTCTGVLASHPLSRDIHDDTEKKITPDDVTAAAYIEAHKAAKPFVNKPIPYYEDHRIICGDNKATGFFTQVYKDFADNMSESGIPYGAIEVDDSIEYTHYTEETDVSDSSRPSVGVTPQLGKRNFPGQSSGSKTKARRKKRARKIPEGIADLIQKIGDIADAIRESCADWRNLLLTALWSFEGQYDNNLLDQAYAYLCKDEYAAKAFIHKKEGRRKKWLDLFLVKKYVPGKDSLDL